MKNSRWSMGVTERIAAFAEVRAWYELRIKAEGELGRNHYLTQKLQAVLARSAVSLLPDIFTCGSEEAKQDDPDDGLYALINEALVNSPNHDPVIVDIFARQIRGEIDGGQSKVLMDEYRRRKGQG